MPLGYRMSSLEKGLYRSSTHSLIGLFLSFFFFLLSCMSCLYIVKINPWSVIILFSYSQGCLFISFMVHIYTGLGERGFWVAQMVKNLPAMRETWIWSLNWEESLDKGMVTHASIHAWRIPWTEDPGRLQSMGLQRVRYDWATNTHVHWNITHP